MSRAHPFRFAHQSSRGHLFGVPLTTAVLGGALICSSATNGFAQAPDNSARGVEISQGVDRTSGSKSDPRTSGGSAGILKPAVAAETKPKVVDVSRLTRQKDTARRLLNEAKRAAVQGDVAKARSLAQTAADIPATWDLIEVTPERFLRELNLQDEGAVDSAALSSPAADSHARDSELPSPAGDESASGSRRGSVPSHAPGGWTSSAGVRRIPTEALDMTDDPAESMEWNAAESAIRDQAPSGADDLMANDAVTDAPAVEFGGPASLLQAPVIDVRVHDFHSTADTSAGQSLSVSSQILINLGSILVAGLVGGLVLVGLVYLLLRKIGPLADIVLKIEVHNRDAGRDAPTLSSGPSLRLAPISTQSSDLEFEAVSSQAESLPRKVFAENVDLHGPRQPGEGVAA